MSFQNELLQQVERIRQDAESFLVDTCQIKRKTGELVSNGESVTTYASPVSTVCRFINRTGSETTNIAAQERLTQQVTHITLFRLHLPYDTEISYGDIILYNDKQYSVVSIPIKHRLSGAFIITIEEIT